MGAGASTEQQAAGHRNTRSEYLDSQLGTPPPIRSSVLYPSGRTISETLCLYDTATYRACVKPRGGILPRLTVLFCRRIQPARDQTRRQSIEAPGQARGTATAWLRSPLAPFAISLRRTVQNIVYSTEKYGARITGECAL